MDLATTISNLPLFAGLDREDLARIAGHLIEERYTAQQTVFNQGDEGGSLYIVRSGAIEIIREGNGTETLAVLGPNECLGEITLFTGTQRSAAARAVMNTVLLKLHHDTLNDLLSTHPSISLHFCKILSQRLVAADEYISRDSTALRVVLDEFLAAQSPSTRDVLVRMSILRRMDFPALKECLDIPDAQEVLNHLASHHPAFVQRRGNHFEYANYLRSYLYDKAQAVLGAEEIRKLHNRCGTHLEAQGQYSEALYHYVCGEDWPKALELIQAHSNELLRHDAPQDLLNWVDLVTQHVPDTDLEAPQHLRAEALVKLGQLGAAIQCYEELVARGRAKDRSAPELAQHYESLAALYQMNGNTEKALDYLNLGLTLMGENVSTAMEPAQSLSRMHLAQGADETALRWAKRALLVAQHVGVKEETPFFARYGRWLCLGVALALGLALWRVPPSGTLSPNGAHFFATLGAAAVLWIFGVFEVYIVALGLLIVWIVFALVPPEIALGGFAQSSWFFILGVLGMGAAVVQSGVIYRAVLRWLHSIPPAHQSHGWTLALSGLLVTPLVPTIKARLAVVMPLAREISLALGFSKRSEGAASVTLSAFVGYSQMTPMFLSGATVCLLGWSLLPPDSRATFDWRMWLVAGLPAGIIILSCSFLGIRFLYRPLGADRTPASRHRFDTQLEILGPMTTKEWIIVLTVMLAVLGFLFQPFGVGPAWFSVGALLVFLTTGVLDSKGLKNRIDWGYLLFLGIVSGMTAGMLHLGIDSWIVTELRPFLSALSNPTAFLMIVALAIYAVRFVLRKTPTVILALLLLTPMAQHLEIHPGVLLLTVLIALDSWFLPHQTTSYEIAYYSTEEDTFSHSQARRLMAFRFLGSFVAIAVSVPYWVWLGLIR